MGDEMDADVALLKELRELMAKATPGSMQAVPVQGHDGHRSWSATRVYLGDDRHFELGTPRHASDGALIAAAHNALPRLLEALAAHVARRPEVEAAKDAVVRAALTSFPPSEGHYISAVGSATAALRRIMKVSGE
jgi:hypothetical protein